MAIDYSIGFTEAEVLEILSVQKEELKKTLSAFSGFGKLGDETQARRNKLDNHKLPTGTSKDESEKVRTLE